MSEQERNLTTFHNLCVMAHADGVIHENEISVLAELAGNLGMDPEKASEMIANAANMNFIIPESQEEKLNELRRVVLIMITDGEIHPDEYAKCLLLAQALEINQTYLDKIIDFYQEKQKEHTNHISIFQNLFLVAAADGDLTEREEEFLREVADNLGLAPSDIDHILSNHKDLDFIIPEDEEERFFSLKNLVYMMVIDGEIQDSEYNLCLNFAERIGMGEEDIENILEEYEQIRKERLANQSEVDSYNIDVCLDIFNALGKLNITVTETIDRINHCRETLVFSLSEGASIEDNRIFCEFLWLLFIRASNLSREHREFIPLLLELARQQNNLLEIREYIIELEKSNGGTIITLPDLPSEQISQDLVKYFEKYG
jgi:uncharacterized tellurite resistance protein B-like protein